MEFDINTDLARCAYLKKKYDKVLLWCGELERKNAKLEKELAEIKWGMCNYSLRGDLKGDARR